MSAQESRASFEAFHSHFQDDDPKSWWAKCMDIEEPERSGFLCDVVTSSPFTRFFFLVIVVNAGFTIISTNEQAATLDPNAINTYLSMEIVFCILFAGEIVMKILVHRLYYFWNREWAWNWFDFLLVVTAGAEIIFELVGLSAPNLEFLRTFRVMRASKILRVFRAVRFLSELRLMIDCVLGSIMSLFWSCVLLLFVLMVGSLVFVQSLTVFQVDHPEKVDEALRQEITDLFGSTTRGMITLFQSSTGGRDWGPLFEMVSLQSALYGVLFLVYILFFLFALVNIVTSIFVDRAMRLAVPDEESLFLEKQHREICMAQEMKDLIRKLDLDNNATISYEELEKIAADPRITNMFEMCGLEIRDIDTFFRTLTRLTNQEVLDLDTFVAGAMRMKGNASSLDVQAVLYQLWEVSSEMRSVIKYVESAGRPGDI